MHFSSFCREQQIHATTQECETAAALASAQHTRDRGEIERLHEVDADKTKLCTSQAMQLADMQKELGTVKVLLKVKLTFPVYLVYFVRNLHPFIIVRTAL